MCLDSDIFDLWRSCGDCNITNAEPECQLSCEYCLAGEGLDTVDVPAPRADQVLAIPAAGCSVDRRDFNLECRAQSEGNCGETWLACMFAPCYHYKALSGLPHVAANHLLHCCHLLVSTLRTKACFVLHLYCHNVYASWTFPQVCSIKRSC